MKVNVGGNGLTMPELADICGGVLCNVGGDAMDTKPFRFVCTDSREAAKETLFVALGGERVDGHDYIGAHHADSHSHRHSFVRESQYVRAFAYVQTPYFTAFVANQNVFTFLRGKNSR